MRLKLQLFLVPYIILSSILFIGYIVWSGTNVSRLFSDNLAWGILAAVVIDVFLVFSVRRQPPSPRLHGSKMAVDIVWSGLAYGTIDGILLSVLPVMAVTNASGD